MGHLEGLPVRLILDFLTYTNKLIVQCIFEYSMFTFFLFLLYVSVSHFLKTSPHPTLSSPLLCVCLFSAQLPGLLPGLVSLLNQLSQSCSVPAFSCIIVICFEDLFPVTKHTLILSFFGLFFSLCLCLLVLQKLVDML